MGKLSSRRIEARDRRAAAVHEAGHFVMARHFHIVGDDEVVADLFPRLRIWRSATMDSCFEKTWIGQCRGLDLRSLSETELRMFGIAGYVAESIWRNEWLDGDMDMALSDYDCLSDSDKRACGPLGEPLERAARQVGKLFDRDSGKLWPGVLRVARQLILESRP